MIALGELARQIGAELRGDSALEIRACAGLEEAGPDEVSFLANPRYAQMLAGTRAGAVVLSQRFTPYAEHLNLLVAADPYFAFREAVVLLHGFRKQPPPGISELAYVHPSAQLGEECVIEPFAYVAAEAEIGARSVLYPHCYVGERSRLGEDCVLYPNVVVYEDCLLGDRVVFQAGCVIGHDGFGFAPHDGANHKIPHKGTVVIEDDVEMGANCVIDRASLGVTRVGAGTKTANVVIIGHGATVGRHNLYSALSGVAGSAKVGDYVMMGGQAGVRNHVRVGDHARIAARSAVMEDLEDGAQVMGDPARTMRQAKRLERYTEQLPELSRRLKELERRLRKLEER